jgi:hypothetical protein
MPLSTDFQVGADTTWIQIPQNFSGTFNVYVSSFRGFVTPVTLSTTVEPVDASIDPNILPEDVTTTAWNNNADASITFGSNPLTPPDFTLVTVFPGTTGPAIFDPVHPPTYRLTITGDDGAGNQTNTVVTIVLQESIADYGLGCLFNKSTIVTVDDDSKLGDKGTVNNTCQEKVLFVPLNGGTRPDDTYWVFYMAGFGFPADESVVPNSTTSSGVYFKTSLDGLTWSLPFRVFSDYPFDPVFTDFDGTDLSVWYDNASDNIYVAATDRSSGGVEVAFAFAPPVQDTNGAYVISFDGTQNPQSPTPSMTLGFVPDRDLPANVFVHGRTGGSEMLVLVHTQNTITHLHYLEIWLSTNSGATWTNIETAGGIVPFAAGKNVYGRLEVINDAGDYFIVIYGSDEEEITFLEQNNAVPTNAWVTGATTTFDYDFKGGKSVARDDTLFCTFPTSPVSVATSFNVTVTPDAISTQVGINSADHVGIVYDSGANPTMVLEAFDGDFNLLKATQTTDSAATWASMVGIYSDKNHIVLDSLNTFGNEENTIPVGPPKNMPLVWNEQTSPGVEHIKFMLIDVSSFPNLFSRNAINVIHAKQNDTPSTNPDLTVPLYYYPTGDSTNGHTFPNTVTVVGGAGVPDGVNEPFEVANGGSFDIVDSLGATRLGGGGTPVPAGFNRDFLSDVSYVLMTISSMVPIGSRWWIVITGEDTGTPAILVYGILMLQIDP